MAVSNKALPLLNRVLNFDQLNEQREKKEAFADFEEGVISFLPTYKFDPHSTRFDSSDKQRCPSWTDRVLFRTRSTGDYLTRKGAEKDEAGQFLQFINADQVKTILEKHGFEPVK